jgi:hypothetical protein
MRKVTLTDEWMLITDKIATMQINVRGEVHICRSETPIDDIFFRLKDADMVINNKAVKVWGRKAPMTYFADVVVEE